MSLIWTKDSFYFSILGQDQVLYDDSDNILDPSCIMATRWVFEHFCKASARNWMLMKTEGLAQNCSNSIPNALDLLWIYHSLAQSLWWSLSFEQNFRYWTLYTWFQILAIQSCFIVVYYCQFCPYHSGFLQWHQVNFLATDGWCPGSQHWYSAKPLPESLLVYYCWE